MFRKILIANRGEIACMVIGSARQWKGAIFRAGGAETSGRPLSWRR